MPFPTDNCSGRLIVVDPSNGCSLTRADIRGMTPTDFEDQGFKEVGMDSVLAQAQEAREAGHRERTLAQLVMSRVNGIKGEVTKTKIRGSESVILPYITRRQKRHINSNYWKVASGTPTPGAGSGSLPASAWDIVIQNNPSTFGTTLPVADLYRYFLPGKVLFVEYADATSGTAYSLQYKILAAATSAANVTTVTVEPNYSATGWAALSAANKLPYQIGGVSGGTAATGAIAFLGGNSVSDFESWSGQDPAENPNSFIHWFLQTSRQCHEYTEEYLRALLAARTSKYFKNFRQLSLAEQRRKQAEKFERDWLNSVFFGQRINENQTVEGYRQLPQVMDPAQPDCALEYKANALGFMTQLNDCSRVLDHQGNPLNLDSLAESGYILKRSRQADGSGEVDTVDFMTDRFTAGMINDIMLSYYTAKYGVVNTRFYEPNQALKHENQVVLQYNKYQLPPELGGYNLAIFWDSYFDDKLAAGSSANRHRTLWGLDWTDVEIGIAATNSAVRKTNEADALYNYVIRPNIKHVMNNSITWTAILEDPNRHYIVRNFDGNSAPTLTVAGYSV